MQGFARDFALESDSPQVVMGYFGLDSLPVYRILADYYAVCTRWFASLPVGTQPNRLSAFQGNVPFLYNLHMDDPSLGYLEDYSLFDLLESQGISWMFFEGDIATIRLYDRFRLNVRNVRPLADLDHTLRRARDTGQLPRVIVIEPEFLYGYDDHPPMDVRDGQNFIKDIVGKFIDFGLLDRVVFAITYDEHGGFFDHVPPPGTPAGDPAWLGQVADMFPEDPNAAPDCMGVRVPSIVMSKFISPEAKNVVLDHTSIVKTILLHNRHLISTDQFARFGERVMRGAHLGELMDLVAPRVIDYAAIAQSMGYQSENSWFDTRASKLIDGVSAGLDPTDPGRLLQNIASPRAKRFVSGG
jgi:phospholipase C